MTKSSTQLREEFERTAARARAVYERNPAAYKRRLKWLAWLGYAYLFVLFSLALGLFAGTALLVIFSHGFLLLLIKSKFILLIVALIVVIGRSLMIRFEGLPGRIIQRQQAPRLFEHLDEMAWRLHTPPIHQVKLNFEMNAAIQQLPRLGIFGWHRNTLILGVQLLASLNPQQALAVVAHEMGHLRGDHAKFNAWVYRLRMTWMRIMHAVNQSNGSARWLLGAFFNRYAPHFNAYSFVLARANEFEADAVAAQLTSAEDLGVALIVTELHSHFVDETFWQPLKKTAQTHAEINRRVGHELVQHLASHSLDTAQAELALQQALNLATGYSDTHPALKDRLQALRVEPVWRPLNEPSAALVWLSDSLDDCLDYFDRQWAEENQKGWQEVHQYAQSARARLAELNANPADDMDSLGERAEIEINLHGAQHARPTLEAMLAIEPDNTFAMYYLGSSLLQDAPERGEALLMRVLHSPHPLQQAGEDLYRHHLLRGETAKAETVLRKLEAQHDRHQALYRDMHDLNENSVFLPAEISDAAKARLRASLQKLQSIRKVWLASKQLKQPADVPFVILLCLMQADSDIDQAVPEDHGIDFDGHFILVDIDSLGDVGQDIKAAGERLY